MNLIDKSTANRTCLLAAFYVLHRKCEIIFDNDVIKVKITEIPENRKANKAIVDLFSKTFKIPKNKITIIKGLKSPNKTIKID